MQRLRLAVQALLVSAAVPAAVSAADFSFFFSGPGVDASGTFTVDDSTSFSNPNPCSVCAGGPGSLMTAISGTLNGNPITGIAPIDTVRSNDNLVYLGNTTDTPIDFTGIAFFSNGITYNYFNGGFGGSDQDFLHVAGTNTFIPVEGEASPLQAAVPEPATWAMMLLGFGFVGGAMRYSRRRQTVRFGTV